MDGLSPALAEFAQQVPGFMPPAEGLALYHAAAAQLDTGIAAEIGSYCASPPSTLVRRRKRAAAGW